MMEQVVNNETMLQDELYDQPSQSVTIPEKKDDLSRLIKGLAESVSGLATRFDKFRGTIDQRMGKLEGEMILLKNRVNMLEGRAKLNVE